MEIVKKSTVLTIVDDNGTEHESTLNPVGQNSIHKITPKKGRSSSHIMVPTEKMLVKLLLKE